jgi:chemotaxis protein histidine kinase CheA
MNEVLEGLNAWGCDLEGALERFLGDEKLYQSCLTMVVEDESFDGLKEALAADERKKAFDCAHTLKGVFANMGITPMFETVVKIVEPLRAGKNDGLMPVYEELSREREHLRSIIRIEGE